MLLMKSFSVNNFKLSFSERKMSLFKSGLRPLLVILSLTLLLQTNRVSGQDDEESESSSNGNGGSGTEIEEDPPKSCYRYTFDFIQGSLRAALSCLGTKFRPKNIFEYATRSWCIIKCILQEFGTVDGDGRFDDISAAFFFEETFAPIVQENLLPNVQSCFALAEQFDNKDYWCKTYAPFSDCTIKALVAAFLPYAANCFTGPVIAIFLDVLRNIAPDPIIQAEVNELERQYYKKRPFKCFDANCTRRYAIKKKNGTAEIILYDRNMTLVSRQVKPKKLNELDFNTRKLSN